MQTKYNTYVHLIIFSFEFVFYNYDSTVFCPKGAFKASAFFGARDSENHIKEFNEKFELLGPLMFGLHDGQTEAPKIQAQKVCCYLSVRDSYIVTFNNL
jgi:hypothetical protein